MGMAAELGHRARFAQQPAYGGLARAVRPLGFQRDVLSHHRVVGQPHVAAAPRADDLLEDITAGELVPGTHG